MDKRGNNHLEMFFEIIRNFGFTGIDCDASRSREERHMLDDAQSWYNNKSVLDLPHAKTGATALHVASAKGYIKVLR